MERHFHPSSEYAYIYLVCLDAFENFDLMIELVHLILVDQPIGQKYINMLQDIN